MNEGREGKLRGLRLEHEEEKINGSSGWEGIGRYLAPLLL